jgi:PleD family two-component response regulator
LWPKASDGASSLELIKTHQPDVALLDYRMPGLDGAQVAAAPQAVTRHRSRSQPPRQHARIRSPPESSRGLPARLDRSRRDRSTSSVTSDLMTQNTFRWS